MAPALLPARFCGIFLSNNTIRNYLIDDSRSKQYRFFLSFFPVPKIALRERRKISLLKLLKFTDKEKEKIKTNQLENGYFFALQKLLSKKKKVLRKKRRTLNERINVSF